LAAAGDETFVYCTSARPHGRTERMSVPEVRKSVLIGHSAQQMFDLVDGVDRYPEFLPWCAAASAVPVDASRVRASVTISYHGVKQSFTTENTRTPPQQIDIRLAEGPFRRLDGSWRFISLGEKACKIEFCLQYQFSSRLLEKLVGPVFGYIANTLVEAFISRADRLYGAP
jgi:ribosome-associated toxin RatA of RatAB toxin-antitoxin module